MDSVAEEEEVTVVVEDTAEVDPAEGAAVSEVVDPEVVDLEAAAQAVVDTVQVVEVMVVAVAVEVDMVVAAAAEEDTVAVDMVVEEITTPETSTTMTGVD